MLKKPVFILAILAVIFGSVYFWLATPLKTDFPISPRFDWPDETANYFWSSHYAQTGQLSLAEPLNIVAKNQIHPRSFNVLSDGSLVPGSFLGLILFYGTLAKIFGSGALIYFTPILAILGILAFYGIIKRIFNEKIALLSAILMFFQPAWWYYSVTSMLPNVPFVSLILLSIYLLLKNHHLKLTPLLVSAFFLGLAISIRPAEIIWVAAVYLAVFASLRGRIKFTQLILFLAVMILAILPSLYHQQILYGSYFASGYDQLQPAAQPVCQSCQLVKSFILPFGFHPELIAYNFWTHYLSRLWWFTLVAILGLIAFLVQTSKTKDEIFNYLMLSFFVFIWLIIYYGSWEFTDLLTVHLNTLGLSYVRYWLPLYLLALPFTAIGLLWLINLFKNRWQGLILFLLLAFLFYQSANLVLKDKPDSILPVRERILAYKLNALEVMKLTPTDSVIVTVRKDKVFFPERKVIHTFDALSLNQELTDTLPGLVKIAPVYYYALGQEPILEFTNGLKLEPVKEIGAEILYQVKFSQL
ncbi:MAG: glycosyltransferase family 39 protein [Patescibacteria group bacterium]|jgi:4-amino-4-deoxy-L-arabinose transferase-like glycosyltransferase